MSLADKLATPPARKAGTSTLDRWVDSLPVADREAVEKAVRDPDWRHVDLRRVLADAGAPVVADTTFGAWRRKRAA